MNDAFTRELRSDSRALCRPVSYTRSTIRDIFDNMLDDRVPNVALIRWCASAQPENWHPMMLPTRVWDTTGRSPELVTGDPLGISSGDFFQYSHVV
jgi:hypothetical protein